MHLMGKVKRTGLAKFNNAPNTMQPPAGLK